MYIFSKEHMTNMEKYRCQHHPRFKAITKKKKTIRATRTKNIKNWCKKHDVQIDMDTDMRWFPSYACV